MRNRVASAVDRVNRLFAAMKISTGCPLQWKACPQAAMDHGWSARQFAHAGHRGAGVICFAIEAANLKLTDGEILGIVLHEAGHVIAELRKLPAHQALAVTSGPTPAAVQAEADLVIRELLGLPIVYTARTVESVDPAAFKELEARHIRTP